LKETLLYFRKNGSSVLNNIAKVLRRSSFCLFFGITLYFSGRQADVDDDGIINYEEFCQAGATAQRKNHNSKSNNKACTDIHLTTDNIGKSGFNIYFSMQISKVQTAKLENNSS
jgi:hypothetical protein